MSKKRLAIFIAALVLIAAGVGYVVYYFASQAARNKIYDDIKPEPVEIESTTEAAPEYHSKIDWQKMHEINPDIYAWIEIPGTDISYPVVQGGPWENYYLDHTIEGYEGYPGAIYTQMINHKDFNDFNTLIYGHDMNDGSMFAQLHYYRDPTFFDEHREIKIYLPDKEFTYTVFAAITYDDRLIPKYYDNENEYARNEFLESVYGNRYLDDEIREEPKVTQADDLITLSTCIWDMPYNRYLVIAVKTKTTPEASGK